MDELEQPPALDSLPWEGEEGEPEGGLPSSPTSQPCECFYNSETGYREYCNKHMPEDGKRFEVVVDHKSAQQSEDPLTTQRPRFFWETGPFSHTDLPTIADDIRHRMSDEDVKRAVLAINTTTTRREDRKTKTAAKNSKKKSSEKELIQAYLDQLARQGIDPKDVTRAYLRSSGNSTPQQELEKIVAAKGVATVAPVHHSSQPLPDLPVCCVYCPVCDKAISGTCPDCGYNGD